MDKFLVTRALSADKEPISGYSLECFVKYSYISDDVCHELFNIVNSLLSREFGPLDPYVKIKCLRVIRHVCDRGSSSFKRIAKNDISKIRICEVYTHSLDPLEGDKYIKLVRQESIKCLQAIFEESKPIYISSTENNTGVPTEDYSAKKPNTVYFNSAGYRTGSTSYTNNCCDHVNCQLNKNSHMSLAFPRPTSSVSSLLLSSKEFLLNNLSSAVKSIKDYVPIINSLVPSYNYSKPSKSMLNTTYNWQAAYRSPDPVMYPKSGLPDYNSRIKSQECSSLENSQNHVHSNISYPSYNDIILDNSTVKYHKSSRSLEGTNPSISVTSIHKVEKNFLPALPISKYLHCPETTSSVSDSSMTLEPKNVTTNFKQSGPPSNPLKGQQEKQTSYAFPVDINKYYECLDSRDTCKVLDLIEFSCALRSIITPSQIQNVMAQLPTYPVQIMYVLLWKISLVDKSTLQLYLQTSVMNNKYIEISTKMGFDNVLTLLKEALLRSTSSHINRIIVSILSQSFTPNIPKMQTKFSQSEARIQQVQKLIADANVKITEQQV